MNRQSQWLFEAPVASEATLHTNPEYYSDSEWAAEWETPIRQKTTDSKGDVAAPFGGDSVLKQWAKDLATTWAKRVKTKPDEQQRFTIEKMDWLEQDMKGTLSGAQKRWGGKTYSTPAIIRAWQIGREQQMDFETLERSPYLPKTFRPPPNPVQLVVDPLIKGSGKNPVAPLTVEFVKELQRRYPQVRADTYRNHGGGAFTGRGFSIDLWLDNSPKDERGFWQPKDTLALLREVHQAARIVGAEWRVLYNDYSVARVINQETRARRVAFIGNTFRGGLNWHGPHPLILHFHLDLAPLPGIVPGTSHPLSSIPSLPQVDKPGQAKSIASLPTSLADAVKSGTLTLAVASRILAGERDVNTLTNLVFYTRHPKLPTGYRIQPHEKGLVREWLDIRDKLIKPLLQRLKTSPINEPQRVSSERPLAKSTASAELNRFRGLVPLLNRERSDIPLDFLLGWIAVESNGKINTVTKLNERGYFQIHPGESEKLRLDHRRLSTDPDYSVKNGIQLVRYYGKIVRNRYKLQFGTDLFWHIVKLMHWLPGGVAVILKDMRERGIEPTTWEKLKQYVIAHRERIRQRIRSEYKRSWDPMQGIVNVDKLFERGRKLAAALTSR